MHIKVFHFKKISNTTKLFELFKLGLFGILLIIVTFPNLDFSYGIGIDPCLAWVFNYLFNDNMELGRQIIFPHGPLAFLMYPTYQNAIVGVGIKIILQILFIINFYKLLEDFGNNRWLILFALSFFLLKIYSINLLLLTVILISYLNYFSTNKIVFKILGILLTAAAFYIKAYSAIIGGTITFSFLILEYVEYKSLKKSFISIILGLVFIFSIWFAMYHSFNGFLHYVIGMLNLAEDNSAAAAFYPKNNWIELSIFLLVLIILPFIQKHKKGKVFASLFLLSFFGAWKHGVAREDIYHMAGLFYFTFSAMVLFLVYINKNFFYNILLITLALGFFYINLENIGGFTPYSKELTGIMNFKKSLTRFDNFIEQSKKKSEQNISVRKLPQSILDLIGNKTVDIYPWDYSLIPANNLNWQPRVVIQSYAAYTSWLDNQNAKHFGSIKAPEYIIWHFEGETPTLGDLKSIDGRYLLNDEPQTIIELIKRYELITKTKSVLVYRKRLKVLSTSTSLLSVNVVNFNKWIDVPKNNLELLRAKIRIEGNFKRKLKSFFYKDESFYVYYKLVTGEIVSKKIVPKNAEDGIWINPFLQSPADSSAENDVQQIMFKCSNPDLMKPNIGLSWESIKFKGAKDFENVISDFFGKPKVILNTEATLFETVNSFEVENPHWKYTPEFFSSEYSYSGQNSFKLYPKKYTPAFEFKLDSLPYKKLNITVSAFILSKEQDEAQLVLSIENEKGTILWQAKNTYDYLIDKKAWNYIENSAEYLNIPNGINKLKVYFWNTKQSTLYIDNLRISVK